MGTFGIRLIVSDSHSSTSHVELSIHDSSMNPSHQNTDPQPALTGGTSNQPSLQEDLLGTGLSSRKANSHSEDSGTRRGEEAIARSLISNSLQVERGEGGGTKRSSAEILPHSRLKKKKITQQPASETQSSTLLRCIVPKLGPTVRLKPNDPDQLKKAMEGIRSGNQHDVESGLNFLMGWSLVEKGTVGNENVIEVISVLVDFVTELMTHKPCTAAEQFEASQYQSLMPCGLQQCMAAGLILKNASLLLSKPVDFGAAGSSIVRLLICLLTQKLPTADEETKEKALTADDVPFSLLRDLLHLAKVLPSLEGKEELAISALLKAFCDFSYPIRLRTCVLDVLSVYVYQDTIKDAIIALIRSNSVELTANLKLMLMVTSESALKEAMFEFEGGLDYDGIAVLRNREVGSSKEELNMWSCRLQSEALLSTSTFLSALSSSDVFESFASDHCILQNLVDLTTGKKLNDLVSSDKTLLESKREVMVTTKRNVRNSEMQAYRMILDVLQKESSVVKDRLRMFEDQFVVSAFDNTWQAKQCAMVLSMM